jgi:tRNA(Ile)-lysidine synthase
LSLTRRALRTILEHALVARGERVAIALSGGADSVALVWVMRDLSAELGCELAGLIHVNHGLRGRDAELDEAFCRELAARLDLPIEVGSVDVSRRARERRQSIEAAARDLRYAFFNVGARRLRATAVMTAHTLDDQAETVLLRLLRGAGSRGAAGIRIRRGLIRRPFIECRRADVRRELAERGEGYREDASNQDLSIPRNRVRHVLMPVVDRIAQGGVRALARFALFSAEDETALEGAAVNAASTGVLLEEGPEAVLDVAALVTLPPAVGRRVVRLAAARLAPDAALGARHLHDVLRLARADKVRGRLDLPGIAVERDGVRLVLARRTGNGPGSRVRDPRSGIRSSPFEGLRSTFEVPLPVPGAVRIPEAGVTIEASVGAWPVGPAARDRDVVQMQAASIAAPLVVRSRRAGDRMRPLGAPGRRKLQDLLVDRKVPRNERDRVPVVVDATGRIVWVAGLATAHECRVTAPEAGVVTLQMRR